MSGIDLKPCRRIGRVIVVVVALIAAACSANPPRQQDPPAALPLRPVGEIGVVIVQPEVSRLDDVGIG